MTSTPELSQIGTALVRVAPVVLSSASLMLSWVQTILFASFLTPALRNDPSHPSGVLLPRYIPALLKRGLYGIFLTYPPTLILSFVNGFATYRNPWIARLYLAGGVLSLGHFVWAPPTQRLLAKIKNAKDAPVSNEKDVERWLGLHNTRTLVVNLPAHLCLLGATLGLVAQAVV
ncbi:hypothetical protein F4679DRAFT_582772 [Xylaria curta]|nr:hypothetical protein F4679DRAFT_582772 [Xylaria curta]